MTRKRRITIGCTGAVNAGGLASLGNINSPPGDPKRSATKQANTAPFA